jgi:MerR family redox-sensitive transcriptional activator SoxR
MTRELTIGGLARRNGVATSALRFYERQGLTDARRTRATNAATRR